MKVYLVRHGQTEANANRIMQGQLDYELNNIGIKQAELIGKRLSNESFSKIFVSDLSRAVKTAEAIAKHHKAPLIKTSLLRERDLGAFSGKKPFEVNWDELPDDFENDELLRNRIQSFINELRKEQGNVLIVSHGRLIKNLINELSGSEVINVNEKRYLNTGLTIFNLANNKTIIELLNDTKHLE